MGEEERFGERDESGGEFAFEVLRELGIGSRCRGVVSWIDHNSISWREAFARNASLAERIVRDLPITLSNAILENRP